MNLDDEESLAKAHAADTVFRHVAVGIDCPRTQSWSSQ